MLPKNFAKSGGFGKKIKRENGHIEGWVVYRRREGGGQTFCTLWSCFITIRRNLKKVDFTVEEFLHKKIKNKDLYVVYDASEDIPEDVCSLRQYGDVTAL